LNGFVVDDTKAGQRLDAALRHVECDDLGLLSQKLVRQLLALGAVGLDGVRAEATTRVRAGQRVTVLPHAGLALAIGLPIVHADDQTIVVHKPAGVASHPGPLVDRSVADAIADVAPEGGLAHRLDRDTSGLLLIGRSPTALRALQTAMDGGAIERRYLAIVAGRLEDDRRTIDLNLRVTDEPRGDMPKTVVDPAGQRAVTHVEVLDRRKDGSLVALRLETGRTHQIRAHLAAIGHPVLGDPRYGDPAANDRALATFGTRRTLLHAHRLSFPSPADGRTIDATALHEPDFVRLYPSLGRPPRSSDPVPAAD
jgi:23S rRNA pseudouridine955/2504/2580 synthase